MPDKPARIAWLEQFSGTNLGDGLGLLQAIRENEEVLPGSEFDIYSISGEDPVKYFSPHKVRPVMMMPWNLSVNFMGLPVLLNFPKADYIMIRGGKFFDERMYNPAFNYLMNLYAILPYAKWLGKKIMMYGVGIGPLRTKISRHMTRIALNTADFVTVRDQDSYDLARMVGVDEAKLTLTADPVWRFKSDGSVPEEMWRELGFTPDRPLAGLNPVSMHMWETGTYTEKVRHTRAQKQAVFEHTAEAFKALSTDTGCGVVIFPTWNGDLKYAYRLASAIPGARVADKRRWHWKHLIALMGHVRLSLGMRMHSLILSSISGAAVAAVECSPKVKTAMDELQCPDWIISTKAAGTGEFTSFLRRAWEAADEIRQRQKEARKVLEARAKLSEDIFRKLAAM